ncbi:hypothetical protein V2G26_005437 [Clonostachys chloroleuca]
MHIPSLLGALLLVSVLALGRPYDFGVDVESLTRRQEERILVGRLPVASNGSVPHRLEIRQMRADPYKWDLFILALSMFQSVSQSDPLSWYQVAGIHGVPFRSWNGVEPVPGANMSGYCTHSSVLFPIWHRPYLALVEQEVFRLANFIASMFTNTTEREIYQRAASDIRFPYWDWSLPAPPGQTHLPDVFWHPTITQYGPMGLQTIRNPLYSYVFNPVEEGAFIWSPLNSWQETKRAPATDISLASPPSMNKDVSEALLGKLSEIQQRLYILFSNYKDFNSFGNKAWAVSQNLSSWDSIEAIHDIIHIYGGLRGHMTYVPLSAFDPLFFIHHVSMDRLIAMWQVLNPNAWMLPMATGETSYNSLKGMVQNSKTPLTPFYISPDGTFWDSDMARYTHTFGYTYADVDPTLAGNEGLRESLIRKINIWYGSSSPISLRFKAKGHGNFVNHHRSTIHQPIGNKGAKSEATDHLKRGNTFSTALIKGDRYNEWIVNVYANMEALHGSYAVHLYLNDKPHLNCRTIIENKVGTVDIFTMRKMTGSNTKISGAVPLTSSLLGKVASGDIPHLGASAVVPFLQKKLRFQVRNGDGNVVDPNLVEGLYVGVSSTEVKIPAVDTELPRWGRSVARLNLWS